MAATAPGRVGLWRVLLAAATAWLTASRPVTARLQQARAALDQAARKPRPSSREGR